MAIYWLFDDWLILLFGSVVTIFNGNLLIVFDGFDIGMVNDDLLIIYYLVV